MPSPSVPPSSQPVSTTVNSMPVRVRRMDHPVLATKPVINPSRGPGPMPAPMYRAVAKAFSTIPATMASERITRPSRCGSNADVASTATAITTTLLTVPRPGRCRSGIHISSTATPVMAVMVPKLSERWLSRPWWNTSQGLTPRPPAIIKDIDAPYSHSPT